MNATCCKLVLSAAVIGATGSLLGWYYDELITALSSPAYSVHFGSALLWMIISALVVVMFNRLLSKH